MNMAGLNQLSRLLLKYSEWSKEFFNNTFVENKVLDFIRLWSSMFLTGFGLLCYVGKLTLIGKIRNFFGVKAQKRSRTRQESPV